MEKLRPGKELSEVVQKGWVTCLRAHSKFPAPRRPSLLPPQAALVLPVRRGEDRLASLSVPR